MSYSGLASSRHIQHFKICNCQFNLFNLPTTNSSLRVTKQLLDRANVDSRTRYMRSKTMAKNMRTDVLVNFRLEDCHVNSHGCGIFPLQCFRQSPDSAKRSWPNRSCGADSAPVAVAPQQTSSPTPTATTSRVAFRSTESILPPPCIAAARALLIFCMTA